MNHPRSHRHHLTTFGYRIYRSRWHVWVAAALTFLPLLIVLFVLPLSAHEKREFFLSLGPSTLRLLVAYVISVVLAMILAFLCATKLGAVLLPLFDVLQSFPTFAILPLVAGAFGASETTVTLFLVVTIIWPMLFAIISAQKLVREDWIEAAQIYGAKGWKRYIYFLMPISFPGLITGSIVGLGEGWEAVVGAEIIIGFRGHGLGNFFDQGGGSSSLVFFGVFSLLACIFVINKLFWLPLLERSHKLLTE